MQTKLLGLRTVAYKVADIQQAKEWYTKALDVKPYFDQPFYVGFNICGYELGLMPEENPPKYKQESVLAYWGVDDIHESYNRLIETGAKVHEEPQNVGGDIMVASLKDPWGNIIGIVYNPDFKIES